MEVDICGYEGICCLCFITKYLFDYLNSPYHPGSHRHPHWDLQLEPAGQDWLGPGPRDRLTGLAVVAGEKIGSRVRIWERERERERETGSHGIFVFSTGVKYKQHFITPSILSLLGASPSVLGIKSLPMPLARKITVNYIIGCWYLVDTPLSPLPCCPERVNTLPRQLLLTCGLAAVEGRAELRLKKLQLTD